MDFELVAEDGKSHGMFPTRAEAIAALREEEAEAPGLTAGWMLISYSNGEEVGAPELAEHLLAIGEGIRFMVVAEGKGLFVPQQRAASSGTGPSTRPWFRRPPRVAKRTHVLPEVGTAAGR
jgi:hypothetical protein